MNDNEKELELNFFEAGMGLIIANLELIADLEEQFKFSSKSLTKVIADFIEVESFADFNLAQKKLVQVEKELIVQSEKIEISESFELLAHWFLITNWAQEINPQSHFAQTILNQVENLNLKTEDEVIQYAKKIVTQMIHQNLTQLKNNFGSQLVFSDQFQKLLAVNLELDDWNDLKEGNAFLTEIFQFEQNSFENFAFKLEAYRFLMANESLIILLDFWQDSLNELNLKKLH